MKDENLVECEKCEALGRPKKVEAVMRDCIKNTPKTLVLQLKRFGYDWDRGEALKYNDNFEFPLDLDLEPYTAAGLARRERDDDDAAGSDEAGDSAGVADVAPAELAAENQQETRYRLTGVVVHSGIANAGHYYSSVVHLPTFDCSRSNYYYCTVDTSAIREIGVPLHPNRLKMCGG